MATWNEQVDNEREILLNKFVDTAQELCSVFEKEGCWADFIDPSSGRPVNKNFLRNKIFLKFKDFIC